jgi:uncharacterized membrane protein
MSSRPPTKNARQPKVGSRHPVNRAMLDDAPLGPRIADKVTGFLGSWRFIIIQTIFVAIWVTGNVYLLFHFDPFPFILLNLAFSTQAAYAAPLILLAGNRAAVRDRLTLEHAAGQSDVEENILAAVGGKPSGPGEPAAKDSTDSKQKKGPESPSA